MTATNKTIFKCDLCGTPCETDRNETPKGWVVLGFENPYVDRDFYDKHVCDECAGKIAARHIKK